MRRPRQTAAARQPGIARLVGAHATGKSQKFCATCKLFLGATLADRCWSCEREYERQFIHRQESPTHALDQDDDALA